MDLRKWLKLSYEEQTHIFCQAKLNLKYGFYPYLYKNVETNNKNVYKQVKKILGKEVI